MGADFRSARFWAAEIIEGALFEGAHCVDATLGNGHDALWLCRLVGESGRVIGFDIQPEAVERSRALLDSEGLISRAELICDGHQNMRRHVPDGWADAVMFNLGWLPGAEHGVTTLAETTLAAVTAALEVLREGGVMTICVYPGHAEGGRERAALLDWARSLDEKRYDVIIKAYLNQSAAPPLLLAVKKNLRRRKREA